jgi:hypothetical protein
MLLFRGPAHKVYSVTCFTFYELHSLIHVFHVLAEPKSKHTHLSHESKDISNVESNLFLGISRSFITNKQMKQKEKEWKQLEAAGLACPRRVCASAFPSASYAFSNPPTTMPLEMKERKGEKKEQPALIPCHHPHAIVPRPRPCNGKKKTAFTHAPAPCPP